MALTALRPSGLRLGETADPEPAPHQALVRVTATSLNYGEVAHRTEALEGTVLGWDAAGVNPNGQWGWLEEKTGLPMAAAFADLLAQGDNPDDARYRDSTA